MNDKQGITGLSNTATYFDDCGNDKAVFTKSDFEPLEPGKEYTLMFECGIEDANGKWNYRQYTGVKVVPDEKGEVTMSRLTMRLVE